MSGELLPVLTAVTGASWESDLVAALERTPAGVRIVRRCVDLADLLSAAGAGAARAVLLSADLRRLDRDALDRLAAAGVAVVGLVAPGDDTASARLRELGVRRVLSADAAPALVGAEVAAAVAEQREHPARSSGWADPLAALPEATNAVDPPHGEAPPSRRGAIVAVWGPTGAPGRSTVAATLAAELAAIIGAQAAAGRPGGVLLADADTYGGVQAQLLGLLEEAPGLAAAARLANTGSLDLAALARVAREVLPCLRVLTGIARADRWLELRPAALEVVWSLARRLSAITVIDCGFSLERDEELSFDTAAPRRNGATLVTLEQADLVLVVGSADPVGLARLVRAVGDLRDTVPGVSSRVVLNKVRRGAVGGASPADLREALRRHLGDKTELRAVLVPYDLEGTDLALARGRTLTEVAADSPARRELAGLAADLASELAGLDPVRSGARRAARRGRRRRLAS